MARLPDILWKAWLRQANRNGKPGDSPEQTALIERALEREANIERLKAADKKRKAIHRKLKDRVAGKNKQLRKQKREIKRLNQQLSRAEAYTEQLKNHVEHLDELARGRFLSPGLAKPPKPLGSMPPFLERYAWHYWMRLGVLFQYAPRPLEFEKLPVGQLPDEKLPEISVVTPSFNQAQFLDETLSSVLDQDYPRLEYVVIDGGSKDGSADLIRKREAKLAYWQSEPDGGHSNALNQGFAETRGEIMAWLNSDDLFTPGTLRYVGEYFAKYPEVDAVYGHRIIIDEHSDDVGRWVMPPHDGTMLKWNDYIAQETLFWRRSLWEKSGGEIDESFRFAMDWDLLLRFQRAGATFKRLPYFLGCFRAHEAQKSQTIITTVGMEDNARLRERELGSFFSDYELQRRINKFQLRAIMEAKLRRFGIRR